MVGLGIRQSHFYDPFDVNLFLCIIAASRKRANDTKKINKKKKYLSKPDAMCVCVRVLKGAKQLVEVYEFVSECSAISQSLMQMPIFKRILIRLATSWPRACVCE